MIEDDLYSNLPFKLCEHGLQHIRALMKYKKNDISLVVRIIIDQKYNGIGRMLIVNFPVIFQFLIRKSKASRWNQ